MGGNRDRDRASGPGGASQRRRSPPLALLWLALLIALAVTITTNIAVSGADQTGQTPLPACTGGIDNYGGGLVDYPADPQCTSPRRTSEAPAALRPLVSGRPAPQTNKKAIWGPTEVNGASQFPLYRDLGVGIYQMAVDWSQIAPTQPADPTNPRDPAYDWPPYVADTIAEAQHYGMRVMIMIIDAPPWANGGRSRTWAPKQPADYANFATAIAREYPSVHLWMIWGEPNREPNFKPLTGAPPTGPLNKAQARAPRLYGKLLDTAYGALKAVNSKNLVIGGNTFTAASRRDVIHTYQWIRYMRLPNGKMPRMDLYGHNPFTFRIPNLKDRPSPRGRVDFSDLDRLAKTLDHYYPGKRLKLFLSEWGVPTDHKDYEVWFFISRREQVKWIKAAFKIVRHFRRIYTLGWVHPFDIRGLGIWSGLLDSNGSPKPGYYAFRAG